VRSCGASARRRVEAGRGGDVNTPRGSAFTGTGARAGADERAGARAHAGGGRSVGCLPQSDPWVASSGDGPTGSSP
jgi:hypothetical protein